MYTYDNWTLKDCFTHIENFQTFKEWAELSPNTYERARLLGYLPKCEKQFVIKDQIRKVVSDAANYLDVKVWRKRSMNNYNLASKRGVRHLCTAHMKCQITGYGLDDCILEAKRHTTELQWLIKHPSSHRAAKKHFWIPQCNRHMKPSVPLDMYVDEYTLRECHIIGQHFSSRTKWAKTHYNSYAAAYKNNWISLCLNSEDILDVEEANNIAELPKMTFRLEKFAKEYVPHKSNLTKRGKGNHSKN